jgi:hypothetical protein
MAIVAPLPLLFLQGRMSSGWVAIEVAIERPRLRRTPDAFGRGSRCVTSTPFSILRSLFKPHLIYPQSDLPFFLRRTGRTAAGSLPWLRGRGPCEADANAGADISPPHHLRSSAPHSPTFFWLGIELSMDAHGEHKAFYSPIWHECLQWL